MTHHASGISQHDHSSPQARLRFRTTEFVLTNYKCPIPSMMDKLIYLLWRISVGVGRSRTPCRLSSSSYGHDTTSEESTPRVAILEQALIHKTLTQATNASYFWFKASGWPNCQRFRPLHQPWQNDDDAFEILFWSHETVHRCQQAMTDRQKRDDAC